MLKISSLKKRTGPLKLKLKLKLKNKRVSLLAAVLPMAALWLFSCGQQKSVRDSVSAQDEADTQVKTEELRPVNGVFTGQIMLQRSGKAFQVVVKTHTVTDTVPTTESATPSERVIVVKLGGSLSFPPLDNVGAEDLPDYGELTKPMGGFKTVTFDRGDYDPRTGALVLPYNVRGNTGDTFGELSGTFMDGIFEGDWLVKIGSEDKVAHFKLYHQNGGV